jgi:hypothetical protein
LLAFQRCSKGAEALLLALGRTLCFAAAEEPVEGTDVLSHVAGLSGWVESGESS